LVENLKVSESQTPFDLLFVNLSQAIARLTLNLERIMASICTSVVLTLLEKCLIAPVGEGLGYRFCQPVPHNRDQRLSLRHRVKEPVPKALVITEKIYARMW